MTQNSGSINELNRRLAQLLALHPTPAPSDSPPSIYPTAASKERPHSADHPVLQVSDQVPAGRGLVYTRDIIPDQVLLTLHADALINVRSYEAFLHPDILPGTYNRDSSLEDYEKRLSSAQLLSLLIARVQVEAGLGQPRGGETTTKHEALRLFVQTLPTSFDTVPLTWSLQARGLDADSIADTDKQPWKCRFYQTLLQALPRHSQHLVNEVRSRFEKDWRGICSLRDSNMDVLAEPALLSSHPDLARQVVRSITLDTFLWAWLCVNSRCIFHQLGYINHADNFTLAPMLDMANHTDKVRYEAKVRSARHGGLELCAPSRDFAAHPVAGDECFITYGPHSNESLLSEYGFVLPAQLPSFRKGSKGTWRGSRFAHVVVDQEVEELLDELGNDGDEKIELLQDHGYWSEYTLHPYPEPAYPSQRLIPALRLMALDHNAPEPVKVTKVGPEPGVKSGKKAYNPYGLDDDVSDLEKWLDTLMGRRDKVSEKNEEQARDLLLEICTTRRGRIEEARRQVAAAQSMLDSHCDSDDAAAGEDRSGQALSLKFVRQVLDEEDAVLRLVIRSTEEGIEWW